MGRRLTITSVRNLQPGEVIWDSEIKGLCARRRQSDVISFAVKTRVNGRQRWFTIGKFGSPWTVATARNAARDMLLKVHRGIDVGLEKAKARRGASPPNPAPPKGEAR